MSDDGLSEGSRYVLIAIGFVIGFIVLGLVIWGIVTAVTTTNANKPVTTPGPDHGPQLPTTTQEPPITTTEPNAGATEPNLKWFMSYVCDDGPNDITNDQLIVVHNDIVTNYPEVIIEPDEGRTPEEEFIYQYNSYCRPDKKVCCV